MNRVVIVAAAMAALVVGCASPEGGEPPERARAAAEALAIPFPSSYTPTTATIDITLPAVPPAASGVVLAARDRLRLEEADVTPAEVVSGGRVVVGNRVEAGAIVAAGDILAGAHDRLGALEAGGTISLGPGSTSGSEQQGAPLADQSIVHESVQVPAATEDVVEVAGPASTLAPGSYGRIVLLPFSRTTLVPGTYFVRSLVALPGSTVVVSGSAPIRVYATDALHLAGRIEDGGDAARLRVSFAGASSVTADDFRGTLVASSAEVHLIGSMVGFVYGASVVAGPFARLEPIASPLLGIAPPLVASGTTVSATQDVLFSGAVASFDDANESDTPAAFSVGIDWGDGTPASAGTVTGSAGSFLVEGSHTFVAPGTYAVSVTVTDAETGVTATALTSAEVAPEIVIQSLPQFVPTFANLADGLAILFTDPVLPIPPAFGCVFDFGDGTPPTTSCTFSRPAPGDTFAAAVLPDHVYAAAGLYPVQITISNPSDGAFATASYTSFAQSLQSISASLTVGTPFSGVVATGSTPTSLANLSATIDWRDGAGPQPASISGTPAAFAVTGTHTYTSPGSYLVVTSVTTSFLQINFSNPMADSATFDVSP
jgi:hypothetical protein